MRKVMVTAAVLFASCSGRGEIIPIPAPAPEVPTTAPELTTAAREADPTTTTEPEPVPEPAAVPPTPRRPASTTTSLQPQTTIAPAQSSGNCGGSLPPCYVMARESRGSLTVYNYQGSGASGKWQIMPGTWNGYGGYANAADAPESVQDAKARELWAGGAGCWHWNACT